MDLLGLEGHIFLRRTKQGKNRVCRRHFGAVIQVGVDVAGGADVAVTQPFLDFLQADAVRVQQACTGVPQIMEANLPQSVSLQHDRKVLRQETRRDQLTDLIEIDVIQVALVV